MSADGHHLISAEYKGRTSPTQSTASSSSLVFPSNQTTTCTPPTGLLLGRFAVQSPLTGYEPNASVEVSSTEVTPTLFPSRKGSIVSPYNSGDDTATTPAVSEVGKRSDWEMLASPLFLQERQGRTHSEFITFTEKVWETRSCDPSPPTASGDLVATLQGSAILS